MTHRCTRGIWIISALEPLRQQKEGFLRCKKHSMSAAKRRGPSHTTWPGSRTRVSPRSSSTSRVRTRMVGHIYPCHYWIVPISVRSLTNLFGWSERLQSATHLTDSIPDGPCWTYLLNLDTDILEIYEPRCGLTAETEANEENNSLSTRDSPAYYCKMHLGELQAMWRKDWIMRHRMHAEELARLWSESTDRSPGGACKKTLSFRSIYDITFNKTATGARGRYSRRNTRANSRRIVSTSSTQLTSGGSRVRKAGVSDSIYIHKRGLREGLIAKGPSTRRHCRPADVSLTKGAECWAVRQGWFDELYL